MLRTLTYNVLACTGYPAAAPGVLLGGSSEAAAERFADAIGSLRPDIVTLSESPPLGVTDALARRLGMRAVRFPSPEQWPGTLFTHLEVIESSNCPAPRGERPQDCFTRHWGRALLRLLEPIDGVSTLALHSAHLYPTSRRAPSRRAEEVRAREVTVLLEALATDLADGHAVLLQGDLNHDPSGPEYERWHEAGLVDTFARCEGGDGYTFRSDLPMGRIDYVWASRPLGERILECRVLDAPPFAPKGDGPALSDHLPVLASFA